MVHLPPEVSFILVQVDPSLRRDSKGAHRAITGALSRAVAPPFRAPPKVEADAAGPTEEESEAGRGTVLPLAQLG